MIPTPFTKRGIKHPRGSEAHRFGWHPTVRHDARERAGRGAWCWTVDWTRPGGQSVASLWNGNATHDGQDVMGAATPTGTGRLIRGRAPTFGYVVQGSGDDPSTTVARQVGWELGADRVAVRAHPVREPGRGRGRPRSGCGVPLVLERSRESGGSVACDGRGVRQRCRMVCT
ncbi:cellulose binding domain-containing protein [Streptomyces sp. NPDC048415]|uniref:cellulose binding domain-containing protein n=1 Tax=Streptomyces sp. NPDC048415 TaxID=3154822 RepID=UPI00342D354A